MKHLPESEEREGVPKVMQDGGISRKGNMKFHFWAPGCPNSKERYMYHLKDMFPKKGGDTLQYTRTIVKLRYYLRHSCKILVVIRFFYYDGIWSTANIFLVWLVLVVQRYTRNYET